jgi:hypothetical protein
MRIGHDSSGSRLSFATLRLAQRPGARRSDVAGGIHAPSRRRHARRSHWTTDCRSHRLAALPGGARCVIGILTRRSACGPGSPVDVSRETSALLGASSARRRTAPRSGRTTAPRRTNPAPFRSDAPHVPQMIQCESVSPGPLRGPSRWTRRRRCRHAEDGMADGVGGPDRGAAGQGTTIGGSPAEWRAIFGAGDPQRGVRR